MMKKVGIWQSETTDYVCNFFTRNNTVWDVWFTSRLVAAANGNMFDNLYVRKLLAVSAEEQGDKKKKKVM